MIDQRLGIALLPCTSVQPEIGSARLFLVEVVDMSPVVAAFLCTLDELRPDNEKAHRFQA